MLPLDIAREIENASVALNRLLWDEGIGLPVDPAAWDAPSDALTRLFAHLMENGGPQVRAFAVDGWAEARRVPLDNALTEAMDRHVALPHVSTPNGPLTWRNWKSYERAVSDPARLGEAFHGLVAQSEALAPAITARAAQWRADYAAHGLSLPHLWASREGTTPDAIRQLLLQVGAASRQPFAAALEDLSQAVFGRSAGPAELRALYLNRMYEPNASLFQSGELVAVVQHEFARIGFSLDHVPVDVAERPRKSAGAFCLPIHIPDDVRVSVRVSTPHHLVDMLYHEFGHAVHFSGIRPDLPYIKRNWILSGTHETFSTLFEQLLAEPLYLRQAFGFDPAAVRRLEAFARYKALLAATWLGGAALTGIDAWLEDLEWPAVEERYAHYLKQFTGVAMPPGYARLEGFTPGIYVYPAGYVLAHVRAANWQRHLRSLGGEAWWDSPAAQSDIRDWVAQGGAAPFPPEWDQPQAFLEYIGADLAATTGPLLA